MKTLLVATGSIAVYKTLDLTRNLVRSGHQVKIILTKGAMEFVVPKTFIYLGANSVYKPSSDFTHTPNKQDISGSVLHVELAKWADQMIIAPLSANSLSKIIRGEASDLFTSTFLAWQTSRPIIAFPAMNTTMWNHPFTQKNINSLKSLKWCFVHPPASGLLVCGDKGEGKLPEVELIQHFSESFSLTPEPNNKGKRILITTGATISPLDPVRYLTNSSSGKTGFLLAKEALYRGFHVHMIAGLHATKQLESLLAHPNFNLQRVVSSKDMKVAVENNFSFADYYISSAAINDIEFVSNENKIKKKDLKTDGLPFQKSFDILKWVLENKNSKQKVVGFAAETHLNEEILMKKWNDKKVDLLIGTQVNSGLTGGSLQGFKNLSAEYSLVIDGIYNSSQRLNKEQLATTILDHLQ